MKKRLPMVIFFTILLSIAQSHAQRVSKESFQHNYARNPLQNLDPAIKNYRVETIIPWEAGEMAKQKAYEAELQDAEDEYMDAQTAYAEKNIGLKILENKLGTSQQPVKRHVQKPILKPLPSKTAMAAQVRLDGYQLADDNAVLIRLTLQESAEPTPKEISTTTKDGVTKKSYQVKVRQIVKYEMISPNGEIIHSGIVPYTKREQTITSGSYKAGSDWLAYKRDSWPDYLRNQQKKLWVNQCKAANNTINYRFGYSTASRYAVVYRGEGKKFNYDQQLLASKRAQRAYEGLTSDQEAAFEKLNEAIEIWKNELKDSKPEEKKTRINAAITQALHCNILEAYIILGEYAKAEDELDTIDLMPDLKSKFRRQTDDLRDFLKDEKKRNS